MEITSKIIGILKQDKEFSDWWHSDEIKIPYFDNKKLRITFMNFEPEQDKNFLAEADRALDFFLNLNETDRTAVSSLVYQNCMDFVDMVGIEDVDEEIAVLKDENKIWEFVYPTEIYVSRRHRRDKDIYVQIACECGWEEEHGLQLIFRQGKKLTRVSDQDGHLTEADAYDTPDEDDELLSRF